MVTDTVKEQVKESNHDSLTVQTKECGQDSFAIGNICFELNQSEFQKQKQIFLSKHTSLGGLKISCLNGYFYNNKLAGLQIISVNNNKLNHESWYFLYCNKYPGMETDYKKIRVHDNNANNTIAKSYIDLLNYEFVDVPHKTLGACQALKPGDNIWAQAEAQLVLEALDDKSILRKYWKEITYANSLDNYQRVLRTYSIAQRYYKQYYDQASEDVKRFNLKHKNDPSYSIIIILSKPILEEYNKQQQILVEKQKQQKQKEIEIL